MPDNIPHIPIPRNTWVDLYDLSGIAVGQPLLVENVGVCDIYLAVQATQPPNDHDAYNILKRDDDIRLANKLGDVGAWAFCNTSEGRISVAVNEGFLPLLAAMAHDGDGNPISSFRGALDVHLADVHNVPVNDFFHTHDLAAVTTLAVAATAGDTQVDVVDVTGFAAGEYVHLGPIPNTQEPIHPQITDVDAVNDILTLDRPIDLNYVIGEDVTQSVINMAPGSVAATLTDPIANRYSPRTGNVEHIKRILISMQHTTAPDDSKFGGIAALTNGVVLRASVNGQIGTFTNWKNNGDLILDMYDVAYTDKAGGGLHGTSGRGSFSRLDVAIPLNSANGDYLELLVQDDLTGLASFKIKAQGHVEGA